MSAMFERIVVRHGAGAAAAVAVAGLVLGLAGCGSGAGNTANAGSGSNATTLVTSSDGGTGGLTPPSVGSGVGSGVGGGATAGGGGQAPAAGGCTLGELGVSLGAAFPNGAPGSLARPVVLTNTGSSACTVLGWPGVAALDGSGDQAYQAARAGSSGAKITLRPGAAAAGVLYAVTSLGPSGSGAPSCPSTPRLLVTPPNETHSTQVPLGATMCVAPALTALSPGATGGGSAQAAAEFIEAQNLWKAGADAISAVQGAYWTEAAGLLENAANSAAPGSTGFAAAAQHLTQLAALPDADETSAQQAEAHTDLSDLNAFFGTPGLYS